MGGVKPSNAGGVGEPRTVPEQLAWNVCLDMDGCFAVLGIAATEPVG